MSPSIYIRFVHPFSLAPKSILLEILRIFVRITVKIPISLDGHEKSDFLFTRQNKRSYVTSRAVYRSENVLIIAKFVRLSQKEICSYFEFGIDFYNAFPNKTKNKKVNRSLFKIINICPKNLAENPGDFYAAPPLVVMYVYVVIEN